MVNQATGFSTGSAPPALETWHFWQVQRASGVFKVYFNEIELATGTDNSAIGTNGELLIASVNNGGNTNFAVVGNSSNIRLTVGATRSITRPIAPFPTA